MHNKGVARRREENVIFAETALRAPNTTARSINLFFGRFDLILTAETTSIYRIFGHLVIQSKLTFSCALAKNKVCVGGQELERKGTNPVFVVWMKAIG